MSFRRLAQSLRTFAAGFHPFTAGFMGSAPAALLLWMLWVRRHRYIPDELDVLLIVFIVIIGFPWNLLFFSVWMMIVVFIPDNITRSIGHIISMIIYKEYVELIFLFLVVLGSAHLNGICLYQMFLQKEEPPKNTGSGATP